MKMYALFSVEWHLHVGDDVDDYREHHQHGSPAGPRGAQGGLQETNRLK